MPLTDVTVRTAKPRDKTYKLSDSRQDNRSVLYRISQQTMLELGLGQLRDAGPVQLMGLRQTEVFGNHPLGNRQARGDCLMGELVEQFESENIFDHAYVQWRCRHRSSGRNPKGYDPRLGHTQRPRIDNIDEAAGRRRHLSDQQFVPPRYRGHGSGQNGHDPGLPGHDAGITGHARPEYALS